MKRILDFTSRMGSTGSPLGSSPDLHSPSLLDQDVLSSVRFSDEIVDAFTLIWLDSQSNAHNIQSLETKGALLKISPKCLFYEHASSFLEAIDQSTFNGKKILLVVEERFVHDIISRAGIRDTISGVIILCEYPFQYNKLKGTLVVDVCGDLISLRKAIQREISSLKLNLSGNQSFTSIRCLSLSNADESGRSGVYHRYMLCVDLLKRMPQTDEAKEMLLKKCEDYYRAEEPSLMQIRDFRQGYTSDQAVMWYTRDSFVYRMVNLAFRTEDITVWYIFRFYITDLCRQLEEVYRKQEQLLGPRSLKLYRGQARMSQQDLGRIQARIGGLVGTTGFFSTTRNRSVAEMFTWPGPRNSDLVGVMFEIAIDTSQVKNMIFVDVFQHFDARNELNNMASTEEEFLFNIGSVFRIKSVEYDESLKLWYIKLEGTEEGTDVTKRFIEPKLERFQLDKMNLLFGQEMLKAGYYNESHSYFQLMLKQLPRSDKLSANIYEMIGNMQMCVTNWNEALINFDEAYRFRKTYCSGNHPDLGITLNYLGNYYKAIDDTTSALKCYEQSLKCATSPMNIAVATLNMAIALNKEQQYLQARELCHEAMHLFQQIEPCPNAEIMMCHGTMGDIHCAYQEYKHAEPWYLSAFDLAKKHAFIEDRHVIYCIDALANVYQHRDAVSGTRAKDFCLKQLSFYEGELPKNHVNIAHILMILGKLTDDMNCYKRALNIFEKKISYDYAATAECLEAIAKHHGKRRLYMEALNFQKRAFEIQTLIYPANHAVIDDSRKSLRDWEGELRGQHDA